MDFIVVEAYSPSTARSWHHAMGAVPFTLHVKVKYPSGGQIEVLAGSQFMARQCMVAAIRHQGEREPSATNDKGL